MKFKYKGKWVEVNGQCSKKCPNNMGGTCICSEQEEYECKRNNGADINGSEKTEEED